MSDTSRSRDELQNDIDVIDVKIHALKNQRQNVVQKAISNEQTSGLADIYFKDRETLDELRLQRMKIERLMGVEPEHHYRATIRPNFRLRNWLNLLMLIAILMIILLVWTSGKIRKGTTGIQVEPSDSQKIENTQPDQE